ncbi:oligosaccharide flippase family protein [Oscillatoriales cyanobacterium LEGE 11467]|uniref:Oligosaccharide flippase family protein n=1 Tax=Zarconia navalis LEGE 11467 TaxID=1828826 RepID=A0A928ZAM5_9CYAN|nr:oligosaccharide flippase family protein [Zarconia navalis]MBE9041831.1 oligosaccharide flippase family protein [Zarconia navalis LEGE 11467]
MPSLKGVAIKGTIWTFLGYGASQSLRLANNLILTRLLAPDLFGLMRLIMALIMGLNLFSDIGIAPSIIQNPRGEEPKFFNTAWTIQVIRGIGLWLLSLLLAWPIAKAYENEQLLWLIPIVTFNTLLTGFNSTALATLSRRIDIGKFTIFQLGAQVISLIAMIVWALFSPTIWALVFGSFLSSVVKLVWSHRLSPEIKNRFQWDPAAARELFSFGRWIFFSTALSFLSSQFDSFMFPKLTSFEMLGIYTVAFTFADIPRMVIGTLSNKVLFPIISRRADLPRPVLRNKILAKRWILLVGLIAILTILASFGDFIVLRLYDDRYAQASWMLPLLALGVWPAVLLRTNSPALMAIGKSNYAAFGNLFRFLFMAVGLPLGFYWGGLFGVVLVVTLNDLPPYLVLNYGLEREGLSGIKQDFQATLLLIASIGFMVMGRYFLGWGIPTFSYFFP